ncbi:DUF1778 domain-containing protein [Methylicorpusculum sp.]|uniref:type II toxin -antitoxin system TacA 1-like antitoxin n=1 Tax=Methylicorpusculum sp. TaxID=2713644 RepID=UPI002731F225|nr:DUF1778 domain-containing protein [Methylicorpusculum sp.]MDP2201805.1 DUF1778 domain-containing protein [Methylicorpusculum sp.]
MANSTVKENLLNIRWDIRASELLNKAATYSHVSISEFVLSPRDNLRRESCTGVGESLFLRKLVLGIPAQSSSKKIRDH